MYVCMYLFAWGYASVLALSKLNHNSNSELPQAGRAIDRLRSDKFLSVKPFEPNKSTLEEDSSGKALISEPS